MINKIKLLSLFLSVFGLVLGFGFIFMGMSMSNSSFLYSVLGILFFMGGTFSVMVFISEGAFENE